MWRYSFKKCVVFLLYILFTLIIGCSSNKLNSYELYPILSKKSYTTSEKDKISKNYGNEPIKYSQEYGDLILWEIFQIDQELSLKLSEIHEIKDGIEQIDAIGLDRFYLIVKDCHSNNDSIKTNNSQLIKLDYLNTIHKKGILSLRDFYLFIANSKVSDPFQEYYKKITRYKNEKLDVISKYCNQLSLELNLIPEVNEGNELSILEALDDIIELLNFSSTDQINNLVEYFGVGLPEYRKFCTPIQSLIWLAEDGDFAQKNNPLDDSWFNTVKKAWGNMKGERWDNKIDEVKQRLNHPMLTNYWLKKNMVFTMSSRHYSFEDIYKSRIGDCRDFSDFSTQALSSSGWNSYQLKVRWNDLTSKGHYVSIIRLDYKNLNNRITYDFFDYNEVEIRLRETKKPLYWIVADGGGRGFYPISGPYDGYRSIAYTMVNRYGAKLVSYHPVY